MTHFGFIGGIAGCFIAAVLLVAPTHSQTLSQDGDRTSPPIEVEAENGIEWQRDKKVVMARGNARAVRGDTEVTADVLSAHYREGSNGDTEIWRLEADGNVRISSPTETAYGEKGIYDVDAGVLKLSGGDDLRLISEDTEVRADRQLEFWPNKQVLYARGNASAVQKDNRLDAETLTAFFSDDAEGKTKVTRIEATENVRVTTPDETLKADEGVYNMETGIAILTGSVKITRGRNQLNGCRGEVDMNKGVSKIFGCTQGAPGAPRVRGLIHPDSTKKN